MAHLANSAKHVTLLCVGATESVALDAASLRAPGGRKKTNKPKKTPQNTEGEKQANVQTTVIVHFQRGFHMAAFVDRKSVV